MWVSLQSPCMEHRAGSIQGQGLLSPRGLAVTKPFFLRVIQGTKKEKKPLLPEDSQVEILKSPTPELIPEPIPEPIREPPPPVKKTESPIEGRLL